MNLTNPWTEQYPNFVSSITTDFVDPSLPRMIQEHTDRVVIVTSPDQDMGVADGMVTKIPNLALQTRVADCGNIYAYDPVAQVIGVCHSGWKGSQKNIIRHMISVMNDLGSLSHDIRIRTGPCISWKNYEFWPEVKELFDSEYYEFRDGKYYLNLPKLHRDQLLQVWILSEHIIQSEMCTFGTLELHSYRRNGPDAGRITWTIMIT